MKTLKMVSLFLALVVMTASVCATDVSGPVSGTWTAANNPYNVIGQITVPSNQTLTIQPGVQVIFQGHYSLTVNGCLLAQGTETDSILFTAADTSLGSDGIHLFGSSSISQLDYCILEYGRATGNWPMHNGGAIYIQYSNPLITHCTIARNTALNWGGGIWVNWCNPTISFCTITQNSAWSGGGVLCEYSNPIISNCYITGNYANAGAGVWLYTNANSNATISNCLISGNSTPGVGGGICSTYNLNPTIKNCTIVGNSANGGGGGIYFAETSTNVMNCIVWGNTTNQILINSGSPQITYSDIQGSWPGIGNVNVDPLFVNPAVNDFHLQSQQGSYHNGQWLADPQNSPCIDAGDPASPFANETMPNGGRINMGFEGNTPEASRTYTPGGISGPVSGTWTLANSPYNVVGEINIPTNQTLTIEPGVQVIFQGHYKFIVNGILNAIGTQQDSIHFTAANTATGWWGLRFYYSQDSSRLSYCTIQYGRATTPGPNPDGYGGGIACAHSNPVISHCTISNNWANGDGGGMTYYDASNPTITYTLFQNNVSGSAGAGGLWASHSTGTISNCVFNGNNVQSHGGGLVILASSPLIKNCVISNNTVQWGPTNGWGGGIACWNENGIGSNPTIVNCTITGNSATNGGGIWCYLDSNPQIINCVIWSNMQNQIQTLTSNPSVSFSCIQNGWPGTGNISFDPLFVGGYHLSQQPCQPLPQSPCINTGNPASPMIIGSTRTDSVQDQGIVDMGYHYTPALPPTPAAPSDLVATLTLPAQINLTWTDNSSNEDHFRLEKNYNNTGYVFVVNIPADLTQYTANSLPPGLYQYRLRAENQYGNSDWAESNQIIVPVIPTMEINITPINPPIVIPAGGWQFQFNVNVHNYGGTPQQFNFWTKCWHIPSTTFYPGFGPITRTLPAGANPTRSLTQTIPGSYPPGGYYYIGYVGTYPDIISDSSYFEFAKSYGSNVGPWISEAKCYGDMFDEYAENDNQNTIRNSSFVIRNCVPNPFNPTTVLSYELRAASFVKLDVYDVSGRLVQTLVDGWRDAGAHQLTFDGSSLASGIYLARFEAGSVQQTQKLVLVK